MMLPTDGVSVLPLTLTLRDNGKILVKNLCLIRFLLRWNRWNAPQTPFADMFPDFKDDSAIFHTLFILHFQRDLHSRYIPLVDLYTVQITNRPSLPIVYTLTTEPSAAHSYGSNPVIVF